MKIRPTRASVSTALFAILSSVVFSATILLPGVRGQSSPLLSLSSSSPPNFASVHHLPDGELEQFVHQGDVMARQTSSSAGLRLVQITDGRHLVQSIYDTHDNLKDCEDVRDPLAVQEFLVQMRDDFALAERLQSDATDELTSGARMTEDGTQVTLRLLRRSDVANSSDLKRMANYKRIRKECAALHNKLKHLIHLTTTTSDEESVSRKKRELLIYPGTNWCGAGTSSNGFSDLGWYAAADRCCRQHDHCAKTIEGFATKYNLFNYRFHTISDCECDERFRTCLKMLNNEHSNLVGKIYFNVMKMKCFKLKNEKICQKRSWWGRCLKEQRKQTAQLKDPLPY